MWREETSSVAIKDQLLPVANTELSRLESARIEMSGIGSGVQRELVAKDICFGRRGNGRRLE